MKSSLYILALFVLFTSCEKVINLDLGNSDGTLVIEGNITNTAGPYFVKLTRTVSFSDPNVFPSVANAKVIITDNAGQKDTLTYTNNGIYKTNSLMGIPGRTYNLTVAADGKTYTAKSTMPAIVVFDSLRYSPFQIAGNIRHSVVPVYTDPVSLGNFYRFLVKVNGVLDKGYIVFNDNVNNGKTNSRPLRTSDIEIEKGDNVQVEMQCVDENANTYYFTLSQIQGGGPGGGTTPTNAPNGITGGALGLFSAHTTQTKSIVIPL